MAFLAYPKWQPWLPWIEKGPHFDLCRPSHVNQGYCPLGKDTVAKAAPKGWNTFFYRVCFPHLLWTHIPSFSSQSFSPQAVHIIAVTLGGKVLWDTKCLCERYEHTLSLGQSWLGCHRKASDWMCNVKFAPELANRRRHDLERPKGEYIFRLQQTNLLDPFVTLLDLP